MNMMIKVDLPASVERNQSPDVVIRLEARCGGAWLVLDERAGTFNQARKMKAKLHARGVALLRLGRCAEDLRLTEIRKPHFRLLS